MLVPFLIMLREGMEAALIVSIIASYLKQSGQGRWMHAIVIGVVLAIIASLGLGFGLTSMEAEFPQKEQELFEAAVALIAVVILTSMVFWMRKAARSIKQQLHDSIQSALDNSQNKVWALIGMAFFAVAREGLESVFFLMAAFQQDVGWQAPVGAVLGVVVSIALGVGLYYGGIRLDLRRFFRWTGIFILFVAAGLFSGAIRALHEAGIWNHLQTIAFDLTQTLPEGSPVGVVLGGIFGYHDAPAIGEVLAWFIYLIPAVFLFLAGSKPASAARQAV
ncbi:FTR1 family protein [Leeia sp. TBRC 13508]|uniref:FTR1 family protein n=1 Tax=Leeia speluncae TaxID=2884804 RepID=A0ABS8DAN4_9NEIS|nr:iron uptake transporter permease EfeU [Leeia speluncae]MCB6185192.1 FTR1 family protein [Leeia speluncae]